MLAVGDLIVNKGLATAFFACRLSVCGGMCCEEGELGGPVNQNEILTIQEYLEYVVSYLTEAAKEFLQSNRFWTRIENQTFTSLLYPNGPCVFSFRQKNAARCALHAASENNEIPFLKPLSCTLFPLRLKERNGIRILSYEVRSECRNCWGGGVPMYVSMKEELTRVFGESWYEELEIKISNLNGKEKWKQKIK